LGSSYFYLGQHDKAVAALQAAVRIKPDYADAWMNLGGAYRGLKQDYEAVTAYQEAVRIEPDDAVAWYTLGKLYFSQGRYGKTSKAYQTLRKLDASMADEFFNDVLKERWLQINVNSSGSVEFIDYKSITHVSESIVRVWTKIDIDKNDKAFLETRKVLREKGDLKYVMFYHEFNCVESKVRALSSAWYGEEMVLDGSHNDESPWEIVIPDTVYENLKNAVCD
jgi:tetratricopeptide (TPR) repeat protein